MAGRILKTERDIQDWTVFIAKQSLPMTVSHAKGAKRSNQQNRTAHMWYGQIAGFRNDVSPSEVKGECKLEHGLPIMQRDNPAWVQEWEPFYGPLAYQERVKLFEILPMTSLMTSRQKAEYMSAIQRQYLPMGCPLVDPEMQKYEGSE